MRVLVTGLSGMVGSRMSELFPSDYELIPLSSTAGVDLTDLKSVTDYVQKVSPDCVVHLAAKTNVDECEADKEGDLRQMRKNVDKDFDISAYMIDMLDEWVGGKTAFAVNVVGTFNIAKSIIDKPIPFLYISTDFVFDGKDEEYSEESAPNPLNWYGMTKYFGEKIVQKNVPHAVIARVSYPYGISPSPKKDFVRKMIDYLIEKGALSLISDQIITPTYIDDIVNGIEFLIRKNTKSDIFHLVGSTSLSPYDVGEILVEKTGVNGKLSKALAVDFFKGRAPRPFILKMKNDKLDRLGFQTLSFENGVTKLLESYTKI